MNNKIVCMVPARLGSKRIPKKNLRYLGDKPLISWVIEAAIKADCFDEIYINSESEDFKPLAEQYGIKFYKRPDALATDQALNDDFAYDFIKNVDCTYVVQLLPTGPFITPEEIRGFVDSLNPWSTVISRKRIQIECMYNTQPLNFYREDKTKPSQQLEPIWAYACTLMGWGKTDYMKNMEERGSAYHGHKNISYFELKGNSIIDIDNEEDWQVAEAIASKKKSIPVYYGQSVEADVPSILKSDGINDNDLFDVNNIQTDIDKIIKEKGEADWSHRIIDSDSNSVTLISQMPGNGNRLHFHPHINEWWYILKGKYKFVIAEEEKHAKKGDIIFIPKGIWHRIEAVGDESAIRLAVNKSNEPHVYGK